jgi:hypothetical protein
VVETAPEQDDARIDLVEIEGTDAAEIDLVAAHDAEDEIDLLGEPPIDAEIVSETGPREGPGHRGGSPFESDVRTAPPRFVTAADLDESTRPASVMADREADELTIVEQQDDESTVAPQSDELKIVQQVVEEVATVEPESPSPPMAGGLIDFEEIEPQPVTEPVPVVAPEHPSLFGAEPGTPTTTDDEFLAQLRYAVSSDDQPLADDDHDALSAFFDGDDEERERGWFGRKR